MGKRYRLKNKKRFLVMMLLLLTAVLCTGYVVTAAENVEHEIRSVRVMPGDTLWDIAREYSGDIEIREYIYHVKKLNHLDNATIYAGQELNLP